MLGKYRGPQIKTGKFSVSKYAEIGKDVEIGYGAIIRENAVIEEGVKIGAYTIVYSDAIVRSDAIIGSHCVVGHPSKKELIGIDRSFDSPKLKDLIIRDPATVVGEKSVIRSGSVIYAHTNLGKRLNTGHHTIIREHTDLGESCLVGSHAVLNGYSTIGERTRINTSCALPQSMRIGKGVFVAPMVSFSDNERVILGEGNSGPIIEDFVRIGISAKILSDITVGRGALVGAGAVVTRDVPQRAVVYGTPAQIRRYLREEELQKYVDSVMKWI